MTNDTPFRLILVRHGQTPCNVENRWHGWENCSLTEAGLAQAEATGQRLADEPITAIYVSDLQRAMQTAQAIARRHGLEPIVDPRLRERHGGSLEGLLGPDVLAAYPTWEQDRSADYWGWRPPEGETFREVLDRSMAAIEDIRAAHPGQTVVVVTHMGPMRVLISALTGQSMEQTYQHVYPSTGITIFRFEGERVVAEAINDASHTA